MINPKDFGVARRNRKFVSARKLEKRLTAYVAALGAAGAGLLAATQPASDNIIFTPAHTVVPVNGSVFLDLNHDGIADFQLTNRQMSFGLSNTMGVMGAQANDSAFGFIGLTYIHLGALAARLAAGQKIGPGKRFRSALMGRAICCFSTQYAGPWAHSGQGFLGLKFEINGQTHFGWAAITVVRSASGSYEELLTGYAYDTVPGQGLRAGQRSGTEEAAATPAPASLGLLALGSLGLGFWRRRRQLAGRSGRS
jgi:hypothetical protein